jgi:hypothetical protein
MGWVVMTARDFIVEGVEKVEGVEEVEGVEDILVFT